MSLIRLVLASVWTFLVVSAPAVEVYKDAEGAGPTKYSDTPFPGSEPYDVPPLPTHAPTTGATAARNETPAQEVSGYEALGIANIQEGEAIRANNGNVAVTLALQPGLNAAAGHRYVILVDGEARTQSETPTIELIDLDRGQHTLQAMIVDASGGELIRSERITFYVKRVSALLP